MQYGPLLGRDVAKNLTLPVPPTFCDLDHPVDEVFHIVAKMPDQEKRANLSFHAGENSVAFAMEIDLDSDYIHRWATRYD